jgi:demethylmenaquinone methyltransferase/2-methoxy-6-polyprenyl-1,4-benzoquinol methylase
MSERLASFGFRDVDAADKPRLVRGVFDRVAGRYDLMNDLMSVGMHRLWKDAAAARINPQPGELVVDCAGGTGDMARRLSAMAQSACERRGRRGARIVVVDYSEAMIRAGGPHAADGVLWAVGDAQTLPIADSAADAYCIAFGLRNLADVQGALVEARRVLRPGGRLVCLEFSKPVTALSRLYDAYSFNLIPAIGAAVARDRGAYRYLVESIRRFPDQDGLAAMLETAGFSRVSFTNLAAGVCAIHQGWAL